MGHRRAALLAPRSPLSAKTAAMVPVSPTTFQQAVRGDFPRAGLSTKPAVSRPGADYGAALARLERLLLFQEGAYVAHGSGWGVGTVVSVDPFLKQIKVDLENKKGHRIAIDAVDSILEPLDPQGFIALSHQKSPELERLRDSDPLRARFLGAGELR